MTEAPAENDQITPIVEEHFAIEQVIWARPKQPFVVRYRGQLKRDSAQAHDAMSGALKAQKLLPIFAEEG
ncbi:MAG TPA: hypothetical protein VF982_08850, partial [Anaerolineales bacterium]